MNPNAFSPSQPGAGNPALVPLRRASTAIERGDLGTAHVQLAEVAARLAARAEWLEDDLRRRHEALAERFAAHALQLRARLAETAPPPQSHQAPPPTVRLPQQPSPAPALAQAPAPSSTPAGATDVAQGDSLATMVCAEPLRELLLSRFVRPLRHPQQAARFRQCAGGGLLLFGPPGTGKTHLVRALARELGVPVFSLSPSEVLSKWLGDSEKRLAEVFAEARRAPASLVFIDEIDVLAPRRDAMGGEAGGPLQRLMAQLLAELDGFRQAPGQLLFVGATNRPWALDQALLRPGRFDALAWVGLPNRATRAALLKQALHGVPCAPALPWAEVARALPGRSVAQTLACARMAARRAFERTLAAGTEQPVQQDDLLQAAAGTAASTTEVDWSAYTDFAARYAVTGVTADDAGDDDAGDDDPAGAPPDTAPTLSAGGEAFEPLRFVRARDLHLEVETLPFVSYAMQHAGIGPVRQLTLGNQGAEDSQNLLVEVALVPSDLGEPWSITIPELPAGETWQSGPLTLPLRLDRLRAAVEKEQAHLRITVRDRDEVLLARTEALPVLAYNEWVYLPKFLELAAAYVQPNSPALHPVVQAAAQRLQGTTGSGAFSGYQVGGAERVLQMVTALHDTLAHGVALDYINPPPSFEHSGQKVRLVAETLAQGRGTCLDLAILQAALWEHIGLHPLLVLVPGHAMVACWMTEGEPRRPAVVNWQASRGGRAALGLQEALNAGQLRVFNSVEVAHRQPLAAAGVQGLQILREVLGQGQTAQFIDIAACRQTVTPLP